MCLIVLVLIGSPVSSQQHIQPHSGFQISTAGALNVGVYEGAATLADLKPHGDFGLGTIEGLDGEMVILNGKFYQIKADGVAYPLTDDVTTPFSVVTFFRQERSPERTNDLSGISATN
jgi:acetolactate decarboxylase